MADPRLAVVAVLTVLTACTGGSDSDADSASKGASTEPSSPAEVRPSSPAESTLATTSGPLSADDLPAPTDLGSDWTPYADPGGHGFLGNGTFVRERDADDIALGMVPLGCTEIQGSPSLPVPEHALEATYRAPGERSAVALVLEYASEADATDLLQQLGDLLGRCPEPAAGMEALVVDLHRHDGAAIHDVRHEVGPGAPTDEWHEVVVRDGKRVGMTILVADDGEPVAFDALDARLRAAIG